MESYGWAGGGEILDVGGGEISKATNMNDSLMQQFFALPYVQVIIAVLLLFLAFWVILKISNRKSPFKGKGIGSELNRMRAIRKRDESILRKNKILATVTNFIERTPFKMDKSNEDYLQYNLDRANVKIPGGGRILRAKEWNALCKAGILILCVLGVFVTVFINSMVGMILIIFSIVFGSSLPMMQLRGVVKAKDSEINENFSDFYLMLHYVLMESTNTPLEGIMKSYAKTTVSEEMIRLVDNCVHFIDTYGEYSATRYIARQYREIPEVGKLMRLIRQANEGGDIKSELMGFRTELLNAKRYEIEKRMNKMIARAKASFNILMPVLVQAVVSAMAIYISDLGIAKTIFGG